MNNFQIETFTTHKADITALAVSDDELNLYCSGVDPTIVHFVKVHNSQDKNASTTDKVDKIEGQRAGSIWAKNVQKHIHEHDVRYGEKKKKSLYYFVYDVYSANTTIRLI